MNRVFRLLVCLVALATVCSGYNDGVRIVGGTVASEGGFPYQVSLRSKSGHFCGGSILNKRWILTAGHCVVGQKAERVTAVVGTNLLSRGGDSYTVEKLLLHGNYDPLGIKNDIGLVRVTNDIVFGPKVQAVPLPDKDFTDFDHPAVLSGWGRITYPGSIPDALQTIDLQVISQKSCAAIFSGVTKGNICTLTKEGQGACHGDSGGPLTADGVQIGIVSYGMPCARGYPDVYTRLWSYVDWVKDRISNE